MAGWLLSLPLLRKAAGLTRCLSGVLALAATGFDFDGYPQKPLIAMSG